MGRTLTERILVSAPTANDAATIAEILGSRGFEVVVIREVASLAADWEAGAGVLLPPAGDLRRRRNAECDHALCESLHFRIASCDGSIIEDERGKSPDRGKTP